MYFSNQQTNSHKIPRWGQNLAESFHPSPLTHHLSSDWRMIEAFWNCWCCFGDPWKGQREWEEKISPFFYFPSPQKKILIGREVVWVTSDNFKAHTYHLKFGSTFGLALPEMESPADGGRGPRAAGPDQPALHLQLAGRDRELRAHRPRPGPRAAPGVRRLVDVRFEEGNWNVFFLC